MKLPLLLLLLLHMKLPLLLLLLLRLKMLSSRGSIPARTGLLVGVADGRAVPA